MYVVIWLVVLKAEKVFSLIFNWKFYKCLYHNMHSFSITDYGLAAIVLPHNLASESLGVGYSGSSLLLMQEYWIRIWHHVLCYLNNYFNLHVCLFMLSNAGHTSAFHHVSSSKCAAKARKCESMHNAHIFLTTNIS